MNGFKSPGEGRQTPIRSIKGSLKVWRPWQLKQLELCQGVAVSTPSRQHLTQEYLLVCGQSGTVDFQNRNTRIKGQIVDGTLLVIEPGETWTSQTQDFTFHHLFIDPTWLQWLATELLQREPSLLHFPSHPLFDPSLSKALRDFAARSLAPASRLQQEEMLLHLLAPLLLSHAQDARALSQPKWEPPAIKHAKEYLQAHCTQEVSLQELARVANLSPFHLARVFRQTVGLPPHAYQTQLRLARARTLLAQGYELDYVAHETGFFDQAHFTQQFQRHFCVTPGSYRKTARFS
jgi:AraC-like DNA-binding protein